MQDVIFREYDIRGKVGQELIIDDVYNLIRAIAYYFLLKNTSIKKIAIGMDGRTHSLAIKQETCAALRESGLDVVFIGICPSPVLYFALHTMPIDAGIMITASHNPKEYNGFKICLGTTSLSGFQIQEIAHLFKQKKFVETNHLGRYEEISLVNTYIEWLVNHFSYLQNNSLSAVIDCGNGAGAAVIPLLIKRMNWQNVKSICDTIDGSYPNHEADPVVAENMKEVKDILAISDISVGIGLDGDADRMACMSKRGYLIPGDQLLAIFAQPIIKQNPGSAVVCDIKSSLGLLMMIEKMGGVAHMAPAGHAIIKEHMKNTGALIGGELSCHFIFNDRYFGYDDGIYAMMRLFELLITSNNTVDELMSDYPCLYSSHEFRIACDENRKQDIIEHAKDYFGKKSGVSLLTIDGVRANFYQGWGLIRASNTQPVISIRLEASNEQAFNEIKEDFIFALNDYLDVSQLRTYQVD